MSVKEAIAKARKDGLADLTEQGELEGLIEVHEILNERSIWPVAFQEEGCPFAIAADASGRYLTWFCAMSTDWFEPSYEFEIGNFADEFEAPAEQGVPLLKGT